MQKISSTLKELSANTLLSGISEITSIFLFLLLILAARYLGNENFGIFSFSLAFVSIFGIINDGGLRFVYLRTVARDSSVAAQKFRQTVGVQCILSILSLLLILLAIYLLDAPAKTRWTVYALAIAEVLRYVKLFLRFVFKAANRFELETITVLVERSLLLVVGTLVLILRSDVIWFAGAFIFVRVIDVGLTLLILRRFIFSPVIQFTFAEWLPLIWQGLPFAVTGAVMLLLYQIDTVMLSIFKGDLETAWYSAAYRLIQGLILFTLMLSGSLYPLLSRSHDDPYTITLLFRQGMRYALMIAIPLTLLGWGVAEQVILLIYGQEYQNSVITLQILLVGVTFTFLHEIGRTVMASIDKQKEALVIGSVVLTVNILLNLLLIPRYGRNGAAVTTVFSEFLFGLFIAYYLASQGYQIPYMRLSSLPLLAASIMAIIPFIYSGSFLLTSMILVFGYLTLLTLFAFWSDEEVLVFKQSVSRIHQLLLRNNVTFKR